MPQSVCPACGAVIADAAVHKDSHDAISRALAFVTASQPQPAPADTRWVGGEVLLPPEPPSVGEAQAADVLRGRAVEAFAAYDTARAALAAYLALPQPPTPEQVVGHVQSLTVIVDGFLEASKGLAQLATRNLDPAPEEV